MRVDLIDLGNETALSIVDNIKRLGADMYVWINEEVRA